jgi:hypothetical protein
MMHHGMRLVGLEGRAGRRIGAVGGWMIPGSIILVIYERINQMTGDGLKP